MSLLLGNASQPDLLDSQRMASLIEMFSVNYDFTIIDTFLERGADAPVLGKMADGVLVGPAWGSRFC